MTPGPEIDVSVTVQRHGFDGLNLVYRMTGDIAAVRRPASAEFERADELWKTTCFEAFIGGTETQGYIELNLSPSSQWAAYAFVGERQGMRPAVVDDTAISVMPDRFELWAVFGGLRPRDLGRGLPWRLGLSAVIQAVDGSISYWAVTHPGDKPDFHHPASRVLELP